MSKVKKSHITLRIDAKNLEKLRQEAQEKSLSTNVLINQIFDSYTSWHSYAPQAGMISVLRDLPVLLFDNMTFPELEKLAKKIISAKIHDAILLLNGEFNFESAVSLAKSWLKVSGFPYRYETANSSYKLIMQFDMGKKWSFFIARCFEEMFHTIKEIKTQSEVTDNSVALILKKV